MFMVQWYNFDQSNVFSKVRVLENVTKMYYSQKLPFKRFWGKYNVF